MPDLSTVERLTALRGRLAAQIKVEADGSKLASLSREYRAVLAEIDRLGGEKRTSRVDEIAAKRAKRRRAASAGSD